MNIVGSTIRRVEADGNVGATTLTRTRYTYDTSNRFISRRHPAQILLRPIPRTEYRSDEEVL